MLTLKQYIDKIIEHRLKVTPVIENDEITGWRAGQRPHGLYAISNDPINAVSALVNQIEGRIS